MKNNLVSLYEFYLKVDEVVNNNNRYKHHVNAIDDMVVDVNTLARFKRHLQEEYSVKIEMRLKHIWLMVVRILMVIS